MDAALLNPFQIQTPDILERHGGNSKGVGTMVFQESIQAVCGGATGNRFRRGPLANNIRNSSSGAPVFRFTATATVGGLPAEWFE